MVHKKLASTSLMAPKKAMKAMKVMKLTLGKVKAKAKEKAKASTEKALGKAKLNKKSLEKLGNEFEGEN